MMISRVKRYAQLSDRSKRFDDNSSKEPSMTVPDEAMTIPYILSRYVKGIPIPSVKSGTSLDSDNFDSPDWEKVRNMDLTDHEDFREELKEIQVVAKQQSDEKRKKVKVTEPPVPTPEPPPAPVEQ